MSAWAFCAPVFAPPWCGHPCVCSHLWSWLLSFFQTGTLPPSAQTNSESLLAPSQKLQSLGHPSRPPLSSPPSCTPPPPPLLNMLAPAKEGRDTGWGPEAAEGALSWERVRSCLECPAAAQNSLQLGLKSDVHTLQNALKTHDLVRRRYSVHICPSGPHKHTKETRQHTHRAVSYPLCCLSTRVLFVFVAALQGPDLTHLTDASLGQGICREQVRAGPKF